MDALDFHGPGPELLQAGVRFVEASCAAPALAKDRRADRDHRST
jgi:hypothetical protein